ncbi:extracellular mutant protein 11-domain-containing protein [Lasiosphaeria miniovina]|uniref:Extracellular mutant protein 11-domain-containing protein n=1 Tax=Lasiosphaeria miniovina TaxID=1954250 RepID=A0AA40DIZ5_9PEZI|nr:extracellular mutant protein 11-domain-containing protein [Lasiosphaeria miniovina]KAK0701658.1 extracellular mutant protein 11-domain-containing protein [Lasiosphaeria miniovina]
MPTAKKKLGGMGGLFMRQSDGSVSGPGNSSSSSNPRAGVVGLPASPAPVVGHAQALAQAQAQAQAHLQQLQPPPEIVTARQQAQDAPTVTTRSIPVPKGSRFAATSTPAASSSLPAQHFHPMQRTRTSASDNAGAGSGGAAGTARGQNAWEDSTVASMFGDNESRAASDSRYRGHQPAHGRHYSDAPYQRPHQSHAPPSPPKTQQQQQQQQHNQNQRSRHDENLPFVIGENGLLKVITPPNGPISHTTVPLVTGISSGIPHNHQAVRLDDVYQDERQLYDSPPSKLNLRRTKLPHRDARDLKRDSFSDRSEGQGLGMSPDRNSEAGSHIDKLRLEERVRRDREREREREEERERDRQLERERDRELLHKRSTVFENLSAVELDEPAFNNTQAAVIQTSSEISPEDIKDAALQRTPRAVRQQPVPQQQQQHQQQHQQQLQLQQLQANLFNVETSLRRTESRRLKEPAAKETSVRKRRHSLDYNDAELHAMSYSDLRGQEFDFDPQAAALQQQAALPAGGPIEERLEHYKRKGSLDQHEFFTRITVDEWDEAGDWFLEQFTSVVQNMKKARRNKRKLIQSFEGEVAAREEAVRVKIEGIGRTLEDLKQEGQTMMQGKDMDLEF